MSTFLLRKDTPLARRIREAIGASETGGVLCYAPPHAEREDGKEILYYPLALADFEALRQLPPERLINLGLRPWDDSGLLLFPMEWYGLIPEGFEVVTISGETKEFVPGVTDHDCRFGVLAYGILPALAEGGGQ